MPQNIPQLISDYINIGDNINPLEVNFFTFSEKYSPSHWTEGAFGNKIEGLFRKNTDFSPGNSKKIPVIIMDSNINSKENMKLNSGSAPFSRWLLLLPFGAAVFYVLSYTCMRQLAQSRVDEVLIVALREGITFLGGLPIYLSLLGKGKTPVPKLKYVLIFLTTSIFVQFFGNIFQQRSFEVVGMGVTTASVWSGQLLWAPIIAWFLLKERLSLRLAASLGIVFIALLFLTPGAQVQDTVVTEAHSASLAMQFVLLSTCTGIIFATSNCVIRWVCKAGNSPFFAVVFLPGTGAVGLIAYDFFLHGFTSYALLTPTDYMYTFLAGFTNFLAFVCMTVGLRYISMVKVCVITIFQLALAPVVGCLAFSEPMNAFIFTGILLVIGGIALAAAEGEEKTVKTEEMKN